MKAEADGGDLSIGIPLLAGNGDCGAAEPTHQRRSHHSISGSTSFFKTCFNGLNALSGVGILSVPYAVCSGGWLSLMLLFLIAGCTFYTSLLIQRCMDLDTNIRSYPDIGERAFGTKGRVVVSVAMNVELYLVATGFLILEGDNLHNLYPDIGGVVIGGKQCFILIIGLIVLPTVWLDNMSILSYISATGVVSSFILVCSIFWAAVFDGIGFREKGILLNYRGLPTAISLYAFCYCAHPVFPTLYTSMRDQKKFSKVMLVCFVVCTMTYASVAIMGYLMFGAKVDSQVTLNLPINGISSKVAIYTTLVNPLAKYALMVTPILNGLERRLLLRWPNRWVSMLIRTVLVVSTIVVALSVPFFAYLMSLVGAFLSVTASIIVPCLCYMKISGIYLQRFGVELLFLFGIVFIGAVVLVVGTYTALLEIFHHLI
ncbi:Transmembrane amino acid transporter family protein [Perilla frutescens var. hirtella]|nr:Transmembrane amino acid transporter family protein [Perilla frutescens var. frutescens]KAH6792022.1 Transmembrane amino acid transporter family protein [Perilla frutescens var. hirtella]